MTTRKAAPVARGGGLRRRRGAKVLQQGAVVPVGAIRARQSEAAFQRDVCDLLDLGRWRWHHEVDSRKSKPGFLDLVAVRGSRVLWIELKSWQGTVTDDQQDWIDDLSIAGQEVYVWAPTTSEWEEIERVLA